MLSLCPFSSRCTTYLVHIEICVIIQLAVRKGPLLLFDPRDLVPCFARPNPGLALLTQPCFAHEKYPIFPLPNSATRQCLLLMLLHGAPHHYAFCQAEPLDTKNLYVNKCWPLQCSSRPLSINPAPGGASRPNCSNLLLCSGTICPIQPVVDDHWPICPIQPPWGNPEPICPNQMPGGTLWPICQIVKLPTSEPICPNRPITPGGASGSICPILPHERPSGFRAYLPNKATRV